MDESTVIYEPVATTAQIELVGYDLLTPLLSTFFGSNGLISFLSVSGVIAFISTIWTIYVILAYAAALLFMYLYVYASIGAGKLSEQEAAVIKEHEEAFARKKEVRSQSPRIAVMRERIASENPDDWKLAIIEADVMMDQALKQRGYAGASLGERLRSVSPTALPSINDAWQAHKVRNFIAHHGHEYVLTKREAEETMKRYERVLDDLGVG
jgi:hypothetical protein